MHISHSSVVGIPSKSAWSTTGVWRFSTGELHIAASFSGDDQAPHLGRRFMSLLTDTDVLNSAGEAYQLLQSLVESLPETITSSVAVAWCEGDSVALMTFGHGRIALQRSEVWRWLCDGSNASQVLQGVLQPGDLFLLLTAASQELTSFPLTPFIDPEMVTTTLMPLIQRLTNQAEIAAHALHREAERVEEDQGAMSAPIAIGRTASAKAGSQDDSEASDSPTESSRPVSSTSHTHLISPAKLSKGVAAAEVVVPKRGQVPRWWRVFNWERQIPWRRLSVLRILAVVVVVAAVIGGVLGARQWRIREEYNTVIVPLVTLTQEVVAYPEDQRFEQRDAAKSLLERLQATQISFRANQRELQSLIAQIQPIYERTAAETNLVNLPVFFDFRLVESNFLASRASRDRDQAVFSDSSQNRGLILDLTTKRSERVEASAVPESRDVAMMGTNLYWTTPTQVIRTGLAGTEPEVLHTWQEGRTPQFLERYGDNTYILDTTGQQLWRLTGDESSSPSAWIRSARGVDLTEITSLAIDGQIWLGSTQGDVYRLATGERTDFAITGLQEPISSSVLLAVSTEGNTLAVVEPTRQRIVFVNKETGEYIEQVKSPQIGAVTDVFWGPAESQLYLVAGSVVYRVEFTAAVPANPSTP